MERAIHALWGKVEKASGDRTEERETLGGRKGFGNGIGPGSTSIRDLLGNEVFAEPVGEFLGNIRAGVVQESPGQEWTGSVPSIGTFFCSPSVLQCIGVTGFGRIGVLS